MGPGWAFVLHLAERKILRRVPEISSGEPPSGATVAGRVLWAVDLMFGHCAVQKVARASELGHATQADGCGH